MKQQTGFTLIEMMVAVVIIAIIAGMTIPSYQEYIRRQKLAVAQQEMQAIAGELERFKGKNFNYKNFNIQFMYPAFDPATGTLQIPVDKPNKTYTITLVDGTSNSPLSADDATGMTWKMVATKIDSDGRMYNLLLTPNLRCKTKDSIDVTATACTNSENW